MTAPRARTTLPGVSVDVRSASDDAEPATGGSATAGAPAGRDRRARYGVLLSALITAFALEGIATPGRWGQVIVSALLATTLVLAMWVAEVRPPVMRGVLVLAVAVVALSVQQSLTGNVDGAATRLANFLLVALAPAAIVVGVVRTLRTRNGVTLEAVFGVLCMYILIGMSFAFIYGAIDRFSGSFFSQDVHATTARCLYFSFTTLTTVGYGDLTAASNLGHTLSVSEALFGQIYLVTVVSMIVANLGLGRRRAEG
jgi:Ion channel